MRLLVDTHVALWVLTGSPRLSQTLSATLTNRSNDVFVSAASIWEIAIKHALGRGPNAMPVSGRVALERCMQSGFILLPIAPEHAAKSEDLPTLHGDPFDRLLVAQAEVETMRLLTGDAKMAAYGGMVMLI